MKRFFVFLLLAILLLVSFTSAQFGGIEDQIDSTSENLENNITKVKEFTDKDKWNFIGSQWKEYLLKNKAIAGVNAFFTKINVVFLILFATSWSLSIEMLFIFLVWLFTLLSIYSYLSFFRNQWIRFGACFLGVIALAQAKIFYFVSHGFYNLIVLKPSGWWRFATFIVCVVLLIVYFRFNQIISKQLEESRKLTEEHNKDVKLKELDAYNKGLQLKTA